MDSVRYYMCNTIGRGTVARFNAICLWNDVWCHKDIVKTCRFYSLKGIPEI